MRTGWLAVGLTLVLAAAACSDDTAVSPATTTTASTTTVDPNLGYDDLAPPTSRPTALSAEGLTGGFVISDAANCGGPATSQLARVAAADGSTVWVTELPWVPGAGVVTDGTWVGFSSAQRPSLLAVDLATGAPRWQQFTDASSSLLVGAADGVVVTFGRARGADEEEVVARSLQDGRELWRHSLARFGAMRVVEGALVVVDGTTVRGLDAATGEERWAVAIEGEELSLVGAHGHEPGLDDLLLVQSYPRLLVRLDPSSGTEMWRRRLADERLAMWVTAADEDVIAYQTSFSYATGEDRPEDGSTDTMGAIDVATGEPRWARQGEPELVVPPFLLLRDGWDEFTGTELLAEVLDLDTGEAVGTYDRHGESVDPQVHATGGGAGFLVEQEWDGFNGIDLGTRIVREPRGEPIYVVPEAFGRVDAVSLVADTVFVSLAISGNSGVVTADPGGALVALDADTGTERWQLTLRDPFPHGPSALGDGGLLVLASDPSIFCD